MQNPLQLYLSILCSREEMIFMIRIVSNQGNVRSTYDEFQKGERKREIIENQIYEMIDESQRKVFLPKVINKYNKISTFYLNKTKTYFPQQGQQLITEYTLSNNFRATINLMQQQSLIYILRYISNMQKYKLRTEFIKAQCQEKEEKFSRNEKLLTEPLLYHIQGIRYINELHLKYMLFASQRNQKNVYDVLHLDDQSKQLYLNGGNFTSVIGSVNKQNKNDQQIHIQIETTQEIITTRFETILKELMDMNGHIQKSLSQYYHKRKRQHHIKITTRNSVQVKSFNSQEFKKFSTPRYSNRSRHLKTQGSELLLRTNDNVQQILSGRIMNQHQASFSLKQKFGYTQEEYAMKLFDQAYHYDSTILPINLLDQIAELSFQIEHYPQIVNCIIRQLSTYGILAQDILKTLIIADYLLKYGCSGIIDDLKVRIHMFRNYVQYKSESNDGIYKTIRSKAQNISNQLTNRSLLYKEKEIAKQIKLKIQINKLKHQQFNNENNNENNKTINTIDDILENYIFKYMDQFSDKLESWGDSVNQKLDSIIDHIATNNLQDENGYYFPESCMDEITIVNNGNNNQVDFPKLNNQKQIDLYEFEQKQNQTITKQEVNLLE